MMVVVLKVEAMMMMGRLVKRKPSIHAHVYTYEWILLLLIYIRFANQRVKTDSHTQSTIQIHIYLSFLLTHASAWILESDREKLMYTRVKAKRKVWSQNYITGCKWTTCLRMSLGWFGRRAFISFLNSTPSTPTLSPRTTLMPYTRPATILFLFHGKNLSSLIPLLISLLKPARRKKCRIEEREWKQPSLE